MDFSHEKLVMLICVFVCVVHIYEIIFFPSFYVRFIIYAYFKNLNVRAQTKKFWYLRMWYIDSNFNGCEKDEGINTKIKINC